MEKKPTITLTKEEKKEFLTKEKLKIENRSKNLQNLAKRNENTR